MSGERAFRPMRAADLPALLPLQERGAVAALAHVFPQEAHPFPGDAVRDRWRAELTDPDIAAYVATAGPVDSLVAFAARRGDELLHFGTAIETWGSGLAVWVHDELLATFPRGADPLRLRVFEQNHRARAFYEKLGWIPTGPDPRPVSRRIRSSSSIHSRRIEYAATPTGVPRTDLAPTSHGGACWAAWPSTSPATSTPTTS